MTRALAMEQIEGARAAGIPIGVVLADAADGPETRGREQITERGLSYLVGVRSNTTHQALCQRSTPPGRAWDLQPGLENGERLCTAY